MLCNKIIILTLSISSEFVLSIPFKNHESHNVNWDKHDPIVDAISCSSNDMLYYHDYIAYNRNNMKKQ